MAIEVSEAEVDLQIMLVSSLNETLGVNRFGRDQDRAGTLSSGELRLTLPRRFSVIPHDGVGCGPEPDPDRMPDVLERRLTPIREDCIDPAGDLIVCPVREADAAGLGQLLQPDRNVDGIPAKIVGAVGQRAGSVCLNSILGLVSGGSAGFKLPR
jgi:hypothetical protein